MLRSSLSEEKKTSFFFEVYCLVALLLLLDDFDEPGSISSGKTRLLVIMTEIDFFFFRSTKQKIPGFLSKNKLKNKTPKLSKLFRTPVVHILTATPYVAVGGGGGGRY